jgi:inosine-uridine nucleoside N-ribohydrolase
MKGVVIMKKVIIDTDPGVDDALALMLAFGSPELKVEAVTTVVGNVSLELATENALKILEFLDVSDVPVAAGATKPLLRRAYNVSNIHGETGLGEAVLPLPGLVRDTRTAVELITEKAEELGDELTIVPIGPLTNIASAILVRPEIFEEIAGLVVMGGAFHLTPYGHGNVNAVAEFNVWHDPEAAKFVFNSGVPIVAVGLDVTTDPANRLTREMLEEIEGVDTKKSRVVADVCRGLIRKFGGMSLHDPLAIAATVDPSLIGTDCFKVDVETVGELTRGMTVVDRSHYRRVTGPEANVEVCVSVESDRFLEMFMERVVRG